MSRGRKMLMLALKKKIIIDEGNSNQTREILSLNLHKSSPMYVQIQKIRLITIQLWLKIMLSRVTTMAAFGVQLLLKMINFFNN